MINPEKTIYILGSGAIGFPLAAYLAHAGRDVVAVRTSRDDVSQSTISVTVQNGANRISTPVKTISLSKLTSLDGTIVVTAKSYANKHIARRLADKTATGPIVILQNGVGVEQPFIDAGLSPVYRCVLYITSQTTAQYEFSTRPITSSPIGTAHGGDTADLARCVEELTTEGFPFRVEANIQKEIWKKAIINAVFNSICPLLEVDNGVFVRDEETANLAREVVRECLALTDRLNIGLNESELMEQLMRISKSSDGQLISTLQDIQAGRPTEIASLNLEIARIATSLQPSLQLPQTKLLGNMIVAKSKQQKKAKRKV